MPVDLSNYVDVKERIRLFYEQHPDGRLTTAEVRFIRDAPDGPPSRVLVHAQAYRTPDDPLPGDGYSWMQLPGSTAYTRGSELENTETSAWGRAIGALGIGITASIASANEIASKEEGRPAPSAPTGVPYIPARASQLHGTVVKGKSPVDMEQRMTPDGPAWGFRLSADRKAYQALAIGPLAEALAQVGLEVGTEVDVDGRILMVPWSKEGKDMPPFAQIRLERVSTHDWTLPAQDAPSIPLFDGDSLDDVMGGHDA